MDTNGSAMTDSQFATFMAGTDFDSGQAVYVDENGVAVASGEVSSSSDGDVIQSAYGGAAGQAAYGTAAEGINPYVDLTPVTDSAFWEQEMAEHIEGGTPSLEDKIEETPNGPKKNRWEMLDLRGDDSEHD